MIALVNVSKSYDAGVSWALRALSLEIEAGETLTLLGSSGSGKTTALKSINRLIEPTDGAVYLDGEDVATMDVHRLRRSIGYVFQDIGLFPHLTALENVGMVPRLEGWAADRIAARGREMLELVGLPPARFGDRYPDALSGGQQQRVGVARALAADPDLLLMDEPFGALDAVTRAHLQDELLALRDQLGKTIVFVTHDLFEALKLGHRVAVMHRGELQQVGTSRELHEAPRTPFVRDLFLRLEDQLREARAHIGLDAARPGKEEGAARKASAPGVEHRARGAHPPDEERS